jgi:uncharacterized protein YndB with AHSA1/START domain
MMSDDKNTNPKASKTVGKLTTSAPSDREIRYERILDAPRDRVWRAYTEPDLMAQWWGRGNELTVEKFDVTPGGEWRVVEHSADGVHGFEGRYREVVPPERLVYTFEWDGMPGHVIVETLTLEQLPDGRTRIVTVSLFHTTEERDGFLNSDAAEGAEQSYVALEGVLAKMK